MKAPALRWCLQLDRLQKVLEERIFQLALSGKHDRNDAILAIHRGRRRHRGAGLGQHDAAHVSALGRAPRVQGHHHRSAQGDTAGIKSVYVEVMGSMRMAT